MIKKLTGKKYFGISMIVIVFVLAQLLLNVVLGNVYTDRLFQYRQSDYKADDLALVLNRDDIVKIEKLEEKDDEIYLSLSPLKAGKVELKVYEKESGQELYFELYSVNSTGIITNLSNGNFQHYQYSRALTVLFIGVIIVYLNVKNIYRKKKMMYSYEAIFDFGAALWLMIIELLMLFSVVKGYDMASTYSSVKTAAVSFIFFTLPFIVIFAISLSISNISLVKHEGFGFANVLGIIISILMVVGAAVIMVFDDLFRSGSLNQIRMFTAIGNCLGSVYCLLECFLIGSIICGYASAKHQPKLDKDFIMILGCQMREDGTLYPLLRSRVDRAISFYRLQLEKTGKKAIFVPSGGQGSNEPISEAEAMHRYLLQQGFNEEDILLEDKSTNTKENMAFSKQKIDERKKNANVAFSTTNYHVFRSGIIASDQGFYPEGMGADTKWYFWPNAFIREMIGMLSYQYKAMILLLIPLFAFFIAIQFIG